MMHILILKLDSLQEENTMFIYIIMVCIGVWKYGGTVRITSFPSFPKESPSSLVGSETTDESLDDSESSQYEQLLEFFRLSSKISLEESKAANALAFLFDQFGLGLLQAYLKEKNGIEELPLNSMLLICKEKFEVEAKQKYEALKEKATIQQLLHMKSEGILFKLGRRRRAESCFFR